MKNNGANKDVIGRSSPSKVLSGSRTKPAAKAPTIAANPTAFAPQDNASRRAADAPSRPAARSSESASATFATESSDPIRSHQRLAARPTEETCRARQWRNTQTKTTCSNEQLQRVVVRSAHSRTRVASGVENCR